MAAELAGLIVVLFSPGLAMVLFIAGYAMAFVGMRLLPEGHPRHDFAVGAFRTTLVLLVLGVFLLIVVFVVLGG
jgi:hypothetical protein